MYKYIYIYDRALFLFWNSVRKKRKQDKADAIELIALGAPKMLVISSWSQERHQMHFDCMPSEEVLAGWATNLQIE